MLKLLRQGAGERHLLAGAGVQERQLLRVEALRMQAELRLADAVDRVSRDGVADASLAGSVSAPDCLRHAARPSSAPPSAPNREYPRTVSWDVPLRSLFTPVFVFYYMPSRSGCQWKTISFVWFRIHTFCYIFCFAQKQTIQIV